eukprot:scaffold11416_cov110-Skeletonema_menzelii.AAC.1
MTGSSSSSDCDKENTCSFVYEGYYSQKCRGLVGCVSTDRNEGTAREALSTYTEDGNADIPGHSERGCKCAKIHDTHRIIGALIRDRMIGPRLLKLDEVLTSAGFAWSK